MTEILYWKDREAETKIAAGDVTKSFGSFETPRLLWQWTMAADADLFEIRTQWKLDEQDIKTTYLSHDDVEALENRQVLIEELVADEIAQ